MLLSGAPLLLSGAAGLGLEWMPVVGILVPLMLLVVLALMSTRRL